MTNLLAIEHQNDGIAILRLARPDKHNALSAALIDALHEAAISLGTDPAVRAVVLCAEGASFCAGGDLEWMRQQLDSGGADVEKEARRLANMLQELNRLPKPLIAAVQGNAFGGGIGLMCVCDMVFAAENAKFGLTETRLGLVPATIGPYVLARMGEGAARRVFMSARLFDAAEAQSLGLVGLVTKHDLVLETAIREARRYLVCAPGAVADAKALALALGGGVDQAAIDRSVAALVARWSTDEAREGISAFFDKRSTSWSPSKD